MNRILRVNLYEGHRVDSAVDCLMFDRLFA